MSTLDRGLEPGLRKFSCRLCHQRKVKCDKTEPCGYCSRRQDECVYEAPPPPKRRKRGNEEQEEPARPRPKLSSVPTRSIPTPPQTDAASTITARTPEYRRGSTLSDAIRDANKKTSAPAPDGRLISDQGRTRYLDNNLWVTVDDELRNPRQLFQEGMPSNDLGLGNQSPDGGAIDAGAMLFGSSCYSDEALADLYPIAAHSFILWQAYLDNVHKLCMIIHPPTFQRAVESAAINVRGVPRSTLALLFSVHVFAVASMSNAECEKKLHQPRTPLLTRLKTATRQALIKASFVRSSDITTLTAFVNFLLCMRHGFDAQTLWVLSGVAFRISQRIGLHQDQATDSLRPFEREMRRRLWRQLLILDHTSSELAGSAPTYSILMGIVDAKLPLNINDNDLDPDMVEPPQEREGPTDMIFCQLRYNFGLFFIQLTQPNAPNNPGVHPLSTSNKSMSLAVKDKCIDELEHELQQKFLRYCDPLVPLHNLTAIAARAAVCGMRLRAHHPRQYDDGGASLPQSEKDTLFSLSLKIMQYDSLVHSTQNLHRYLWHVRVYFQWHALIYLLSEMRFRKVGQDADRAWEQVEDVFKYHPEMLHGNDYALYTAIRILALRAWESRRLELQRLGLPVDTPEIILKLKERAASNGNGPLEPSGLNSNPLSNSVAARDPRPLSYAQSWPTPNVIPATPAEDAMVFQEPSPVDWEQWDSLLRSMDLPDLDTSLDAFFK